MYSINNTQAIVLKSYDSGEKDAAISLFTKEFGQLYAKVSGVRDLKSKHRYAIQDHSFINVSLIKGKAGWRITSSSFIKSFYFDIEDKNKRDKILKILSLVDFLAEEFSFFERAFFPPSSLIFFLVASFILPPFVLLISSKTIVM